MKVSETHEFPLHTDLNLRDIGRSSMGQLGPSSFTAFAPEDEDEGEGRMDAFSISVGSAAESGLVGSCG